MVEFDRLVGGYGVESEWMDGDNGVKWVEGKGKVSCAIGVLVQEGREFGRDGGLVRRCMMIMAMDDCKDERVETVVDGRILSGFNSGLGWSV
jgi:hypothetical protein